MGQLTLSLVWATFVTCIGSSFVMGYNLGVINLPAEVIKTFLSQHISADASALYAQISVVFVVGAAIGSFACGFFADRLGRRNSLIMNSVIGVIGSSLCALCVVLNNVIVLFLGRFISGFNAGLTIGVASLYLTEIAPLSLRGVIGACHQLAVTIGILISYVISMPLNSESMWPVSLGFAALPPAVCFFLLFMCPESARYLYLIKHNVDGAKAAYKRINGDANPDEFIAEMEIEDKAIKAQPPFKFIQILVNREYRKPLLIAILIQVLQQLSGINAVIANSSTMLNAAKVDPDQNPYFVIGIGALNVVCTIIALPFLEKAGRRTLLLWPTLCLAVTLLLQTIVVNVVQSKPEGEQGPLALVSVVIVYLYVAFFAIGLGPIPAMIVSEIFLQGPRTAAYSLSQGTQWLCNLIVLASFPPLNDLLGGYVYLPFLVVVVTIWTLFFFIMPETKGKSFDEVARELGGGTSKPPRVLPAASPAASQPRSASPMP